MSTIKHQVVEINPTTATLLLQRNPSNRRISPNHVEWLAGAMERGEWVRNGEAIKLDADGNLLDGQHRLAACVKSGATITTDMITGLPREAQLTQDSGRPRRARDFLAMQGFKNSTTVATIARRIYSLETIGMPESNHKKPTQMQMNEILGRWPGVEQAAADVWDLKGVTNRRGTTGLFLVMARRVDRSLADYTLERLATGSMLPANHPILVCRNAIIALETRRARARDVQIWTYLVRCWNDLRDGKTERRQYKYIEGADVPRMNGIKYGERL